MKKSRFLASIMGIFAVCLFSSIASATLIDLTTKNSSGTAVADVGGTFQAVWMNQQSTGTGVIDPFLRIQKTGQERGYNSSLIPQGPGLLDDLKGTFTHALDLSTVPIVTIDGNKYREFILDINQNKGRDNEFLTLNQIQLFLGPDTLGYSLTEATASTAALIAFGGYNEVFRMNNINSPTPFNSIELNYALNSGSGAGDMQLYIRNSVFGTAAAGNVIFFSQFGVPNGTASSNDGFEEWAVRVPSTPVPEPTTILLLGLGLVGVVGVRRKFQR
ncbi:PEP-CTERM sorting domain-containing protein [Desulforhabdus sp. TSK]|uniref:PEP-CTERM sorting domain-containing protein n=1 Tax=Desulforhabdus sp. TSK TaxID=2925014 RepID=UPI001FC8C863|nr:PEP-CTERM sorting domain-containing protein [Desulforhabdus sp. TSK]GKT09527.1 hypothetical protein DSTSK_28320 [Desulforhabdus sp. TSK]